MEALALMAGGIAHDLNNFLSGVISYPDLILMQLPADHDVVQDVKMIKKSGHKIALFVADLQRIAQNGTRQKSAANLNELIHNSLNTPELQELSSTHPTVSIQKNLAENLNNFNCSPEHIDQCITILITNAIEATPEYRTVEIVTENVKVAAIQETSQLKSGNYISLSISDSGPCLSQENINHLFEPFYSKKKMKRCGNGLNLTIAWSIIQDHDGEIRVESSEQGTTIKIYFPAITQPA